MIACLNIVPLPSVECIGTGETEKDFHYNRKYDQIHDDVTNAIDEASVRLAKDLHVDGMLSMTSSGTSARKLAKYRPQAPIYAITHEDRVRQQLTLTWGIVPVFNVKDRALSSSGYSKIEYPYPLKFTEKTDIEIRAKADSAGGTVTVSAALDILLIQNRPYPE